MRYPDPADRRDAALRGAMSLDDLWADLRQGARNVAGVSWQVAVSVHLLVLARAGDLPFASVTPEGFEDLDCTNVDGTRTFVQMKEVAAGEGRLTASSVGEALKHAEDGARGAGIVLVTDGELGSELTFTGWDGSLSEQSAVALEAVGKALEGRGFDGPAARGLLARSRLVWLPWRLREVTVQRLTVALGTHPTVASFAVDRLYADVASSAADQRSAACADEARTHTVADIDAVVSQVQAAVDVRGLDAAVAAGVCGPADFLNRSGLTATEFYAGVDGSPAHIAARLDVPRPRELDDVRGAAQQERYALFVGPSGSGKSVLLWRAARDAVPGANVVRVRRLRTPSEADMLVRHVRLLQPSLAAPVVVAADDLGRPTMAAWPEAAADLRDVVGVVLVGACRAEDFLPSLVIGPTRVIEPELDAVTARDVAARVEAAGVPLAITADEAAARSGGLLMEFLALLTTGARLEQVLAGQVEALRQPGRGLQREAARLLTAAHSVGLSLDADRLGEMLGGDDPTKVGDALAVLHHEHVIFTDGSSWTGLHELRSRTLARLLHESPPPTLAATFARTVALLDAPEAGWLLRRVAEDYPEALHAAAQAATGVVARRDTSATDVAVLFEGAERADNALYARTCKPILDRAVRPGMIITQLAMFAYPVRNQGMIYSHTGSPEIDEPMSKVEAIGQSLPARSDTIASTIAAGVTPQRLSELLLASDLSGAVRMLEAGAGLLRVTTELAQSLLNIHTAPDSPEQTELWPRLVEALYDSLPEGDRAMALGPVEDRALRVAQADPLAISLTIAPTREEVTLTLLMPVAAPIQESPAWDSVAPSGHDDLANSTAVAAARRLASACPELTTVEIVTVTPSGRRYQIGELEPGYKRMSRPMAFPDRAGVRRNVGFQAALRRLTAAESWTYVLRQQIKIGAELANLVAEAPARLSSRDNQGRRRAWTARVTAVIATIGELASRPASTGIELSRSHARADDEQRSDDPASAALASLANTLPRLVDSGPSLALAATLRDGADKLAAAAAAAAPTVTGLGSPIPDRLVNDCRRLAGTLAALHADPSGARRIRALDPLGSADEIALSAAEANAERQRTLLEDQLQRVDDAVVHRIVDPATPSWAIDGTAWIVTVPIERWEDLSHALEGIGEEARQDLAGRVIAAVSVSDSQAILFTARLTAFGEQIMLPLTPELAQPLLEAAGLRLETGSTSALVTPLVDGLIQLSWQTALSRARPREWPTVARDSTPAWDTLKEQADTLCTQLQESDAEVARPILALLLSQVRSELDSPQPITLAGTALDFLGSEALRDDAEELLNALTHLGLVAALAAPFETA